MDAPNTVIIKYSKSRLTLTMSSLVVFSFVLGLFGVLSASSTFFQSLFGLFCLVFSAYSLVIFRNQVKNEYKAVKVDHQGVFLYSAIGRLNNKFIEWKLIDQVLLTSIQFQYAIEIKLNENHVQTKCKTLWNTIKPYLGFRDGEYIFFMALQSTPNDLLQIIENHLKQHKQTKETPQQVRG